MFNARQAAFNILLDLEKDAAYSNLALDKLLSAIKAEKRDKAFISKLVYGVTERKLTLDYQLEQYLKSPINKLQPKVLTILRLGAYQLLFTDKIPPSAAINESVNLVKKNGCSFAAGLTNAILRNIHKNGLILPENGPKCKILSIKYSCPEWLINKWIKEYGEECTENILISSLEKQHYYIRVNPLVISEDNLIKKLSDEGVEAEKTQTENALLISFKGIAVDSLESFKNGYFHVQDLASQLCIKALKAEKGNRVIDLCAAPGGKSYSIAEEMKNEGELLSLELHNHRVELIKKGAERLGLSCIKAKQNDALIYNKHLGLADKVLCDVPCSGFGLIGKKPEIKYKNPDEVKKLPEIQLEILNNGARYLKEGGRLVYSTCTLSHSENQKVCNRFLSENKDFIAVKPLEYYSDELFLTLMPHKDKTDGFFIACFERKK